MVVSIAVSILMVFCMFALVAHADTGAYNLTSLSEGMTLHAARTGIFGL
jgi:hypothetical protein